MPSACGVRSRFDLTLRPDGPTGQVQGQALLADVLLRSRVAGTDVRVGDELLSWQSLALGPARVTLRGRERPAVEVESIVLSDAYSRLVNLRGARTRVMPCLGYWGEEEALWQREKWPKSGRTCLTNLSGTALWANTTPTL